MKKFDAHGKEKTKTIKKKTVTKNNYKTKKFVLSSMQTKQNHTRHCYRPVPLSAQVNNSKIQVVLTGRFKSLSNVKIATYIQTHSRYVEVIGNNEKNDLDWLPTDAHRYSHDFASKPCRISRNPSTTRLESVTSAHTI